MAFQDYWSELTGTFPKLSPLHAQQIVRNSWRDICDLRLWSFNWVTDAELWFPAAITAGTMTFTQGQKTVQADATAMAAIAPFVFGNPPFGGPIGQGYNIRLGSLNNGLAPPVGPVYSVVAYNAGTGVITLDRPYGEVTGALQTYLAYRAYAAAPNNPNTVANSPDTGFLRWVSLRNVYQGYNISGRRLLYSQEQLNRIDPQRGATGDAYIVSQWGRGNQPGGGFPIFEFYPHEVNFTTWVGTYLSRWPDIGPTQDIPQMPYNLQGLLMARSKMRGAEWAMANTGTFPELAQTNWVAASQVHRKNWEEERIQAIKQDDEINPLIPWIQEGKWDFPLGGQFLQSHDISSLVP